MPLIDRQNDDGLTDFQHTSFSALGQTRTIYRKGDGPAVIVIAEVPGITPRVARFARWVADAGFCAVMPALFGVPGRAPTLGGTLRVLGVACVSKEFATFALGKSSPATDWLRALAREEHRRQGGPGVGVVGMCLTGNFALAMAADKTVLAPVLSQPSLPLSLTPLHKRDLSVSRETLARVKARVRDEGLCVLGLRFTKDPLCPAERFHRLRQELGDGFVAVEIDSSRGNPHGMPATAHSVLTEHLVDDPSHPTRQAAETVIQHFRERLL